MSQTANLTSNLFVGDVRFDREMGGFDFFRVEGDIPLLDKFRMLGGLALRSGYGEFLVPYTSSDGENYLVGCLPSGAPSEFEVEGIRFVYVGRRVLAPTLAGRRAFQALLNKFRANGLRGDFWRLGEHSFYWKQPVDLEGVVPGCDLLLFRGFVFRYDVYSDGGVALVLDYSTHYVRRESVLGRIRREGFGWLERAISEKREEFRRLGKNFRGLHFFYGLRKMDVRVVGYDPRPISEIPLGSFGSVADYLRRKYPHLSFDEGQPALKDERGLFYAPEFMHESVDNSDVPDIVLNRETFLGDGHVASRNRFERIREYFRKYGFERITIGDVTINFREPKVELLRSFGLPRLRTAVGVDVQPHILGLLRRGGFLEPPRIVDVCLYSFQDSDLAKRFYDELVRYAAREFRVDLPRRPIVLDSDVGDALTELGNFAGRVRGRVLIGVVPSKDGEEAHDRITDKCGELGIPSKFITEDVVRRALGGEVSIFMFFLSSLFARCGGVPWVLESRLSCDCYIAVDVGRTRSEVWVLGVVFDREGRFRVLQKSVKVGEALDEKEVRDALEEAVRLAPNAGSLVFLRDGDMPHSEREAFLRVLEGFPQFSTVATVEIKKDTPYRIFRRIGRDVAGARSGDYYEVGDLVLLCTAGVDVISHGTPSPLALKITGVRGSVERLMVAQDVFKLCHLNFGSPSKPYALPAPVKLAHELARDLSFGVRRSAPPF